LSIFSIYGGLIKAFVSGYRYDMTLEFKEAIFGTEKEFEAMHLETCSTCSGSGAKSGSSRKGCQTCGGVGQVVQSSQTPFGTFSQVNR
jgi:molecular chaperone DnaJ